MTYTIYNAATTPDGTYLRCMHNHDYQSHVDTTTGETYMIDGLGYCIRTSVNTIPMQHYQVTTDDPHEQVRRVFTWKSYGKDGKQPAEYLVLRAMTDEHICAILRTQRQILGTPVEQVFLNELEYRLENKIELKDEDYE